LIRAAGDTFVPTSELFEGTNLPVLGSLQVRNFASSKSREDDDFVAYLGEVGRLDLLEALEFRLSDVSRHDSLVAEIAKYDREYKDPPELVRYYSEQALLYVCDLWAQLTVDRDPLKLLSPEEALSGMDLTKSPGYPWRLLGSSKADLLASKHAPLLWERVTAIWKNLKGLGGVTIDALWYSFLKEELRPLVKLDREVPAIRSISGAPVDLAIVGNQLCHDFNEVFYTLCEEPRFGSVVGISPFCGGWDQLARLHWCDPRNPRMNSASIDVTQWDRSFSPYLFDLVVQVRGMISMAQGTQELRAACSLLGPLYKEVTSSAVVVPLRRAAQVVLLTAGMKSGWVNTTTDNTLGHLLVLVAFIYQEGVAEEIGRGVVFSLYGDDNLLSWGEHLRHVFTAEKLERWYRCWGFETHGVHIVCGEERFNQVFLGGRFARCPLTSTYVYCPESGQKAVDSIRFKFRDHNTAFQRVCSLRILHYYNRETFALLDGYARYLTRKQLVSRELWPNYLSDQMIVALHTGRESSDDCLLTPHLADLNSIFLSERSTEQC